MKTFKLIRVVVLGAAFIIAGIALISGSVSDKAELSKPLTDIVNLTPENIYNGQIVEGDIWLVYGEFAYMEDDGEKTDRYFALQMGEDPAEDTPFIAIASSKPAEYQTLEKLSDKLSGYNSVPENPQTMHFLGKVAKLTRDEEKLFADYTEGYDYIPYVIKSYTDETGPLLVVGIILAAVGAAIVIIRLLRKFLTGK